MLLIGETQLPATTFKPDIRSDAEKLGDQRQAYDELWTASDTVARFRDNANAEEEALSAAYDERIRTVEAATGVKLSNPYSVPVDPYGYTPDYFVRKRQAFARELRVLQDRQPDASAAIRADDPVENDGRRITRDAQQRLAEAEAGAKAAGLSDVRQFGAALGGGFRAMFRDPVQVGTLTVGGEFTTARTVLGAILQRIFTEATINAGQELLVQQSAERYRKDAGVPLGWSGMWQQVGLAAAFGGGMGGLLQGGGEVIKALGRASPEAEQAFARIASGETRPEDIKIVSEAVNVPVPEEDLKALSQALEADAADAAVAVPSAEPRQVADAVQAIEQGGAVPQIAADPLPGAVQLKQFRAADLAVDPARFQFKDGGDAQGVTAALKGVTQWVPERADPLIVFEDLNGKFFVGDGHQRTGLARRIEAETGQPITLNAFVFRAADGFTDADVRVRAALKNIGQGSGSAIDAAKVLRNGGIADPARAGLPPSGAMVRDGIALARLSDDAFTMAVNNVVDPKLAAVVGRLVDDPRLHAQMLDALKTAEARTIPDAESMVRDMLAEPTVTGQQSSLFGEEDFARMLLKEKAAVRQAALSSLKKDRAVFNRLIEEQSRIAEAGNVLDTAANSQRAASDAILIEAIDRLSRQVGPVADALNAAARAVAGGERASAAAKGFAEYVGSRIAAGGGRLDTIAEPPRLIDPSISGTHAIEPGTPQSADAAAGALEAVGGPPPPEAKASAAAEATPAGQQILIPGVAEISVRDLVNAADKPMRGGDAPPPAGGLFDDAARDQIDLLDAIPAGADAEGKPIITTHAELRAQGDRVEHLADVISSCRE